jgi:hypothetical protein
VNMHTKAWNVCSVSWMSKSKSWKQLLDEGY